MNSSDLYGKLANLPLFIGMSKEELEHVVTKTKFDFLKAEQGENIVTADQKSGQFLLLVTGEGEMETTADDKSYSVIERIKAPATIQIERTFGLWQRYSCTIKAISQCSLIAINKNEILKLTQESLIFRLNLLNILSTSSQKKTHILWSCASENLEQRLCHFFITHCTHPGGEKLFKIKMKRLASELNDNRLRISKTLNNMADRGLLILKRGRIEIPSVEKLKGI